MNTILTLAILAVVMTMGTISLTLNEQNVSAEKSCKSQHYSHCKGDKGWYTEHGHHHCFKGEDDCKNYNN